MVWRIKFKIATLTFKVLETGLPPYLSWQLLMYVPTRGLRSSHQNFSKSLVLTSDLVCALFVCLHPPYGTQFPSAFVPANLSQRLENISKHFIFNLHFLPPPTQRLRFNFLILALYKSTYLLTYLLTCSPDVHDVSGVVVRVSNS